MQIFNKIKNLFSGKRKNSSHVIVDSGSFFSFRNNDLATNETIFSAVSLLSGSLGSLPLKLYKDFEIVSDNTSDLLQYHPQSFMTSYDWISTMTTLKNIYGNSYSIIEYNRASIPIALHIIDSNLVSPILERETKDLYYQIKDEGHIYYIHNSHIVHFKHISENGYEGLNPLSALKNTIEYDKEIKEFSLNQMKNGLKANVIIKLQSKLSEEAMNQYIEMLSNFQKNGMLFVDQGKDFQELKNNQFIDPKVFDVENITIARIARVYNIPLNKLLSEKQSYSSAEQADLEYIKDCILPNVRAMEEELNKKLLTLDKLKKGYTFKFNLNGLARADMKTRADFYFKGIRGGWFTPNEVRALEENPPLEGGDVLLISRDLIPINRVNELLDKDMKGGGI